jgi:hypothetical protein
MIHTKRMFEEADLFGEAVQHHGPDVGSHLTTDKDSGLPHPDGLAQRADIGSKLGHHPIAGLFGSLGGSAGMKGG